MIFVDTGAFYALADRNDMNHRKAAAYYRDVYPREILATSIPIATETWMLINASLGPYPAEVFFKSIASDIFAMLRTDPATLAEATRIEEKYRDVHLGFVDCTSLALLERERLCDVFTFDRKHFSIYRPEFTKHLNLLP